MLKIKCLLKNLLWFFFAEKFENRKVGKRVKYIMYLIWHCGYSHCAELNP